MIYAQKSPKITTCSTLVQGANEVKRATKDVISAQKCFVEELSYIKS